MSDREDEVAPNEETSTNNQLIEVPSVDDADAVMGEVLHLGKAHCLEVLVLEADLIFIR
jgi:metal-responsive CopG/Arc/MetJ family transcriptional regulator